MKSVGTRRSCVAYTAEEGRRDVVQLSEKVFSAETTLKHLESEAAVCVKMRTERARLMKRWQELSKTQAHREKQLEGDIEFKKQKLRNLHKQIETAAKNAKYRGFCCKTPLTSPPSSRPSSGTSDAAGRWGRLIVTPETRAADLLGNGLIDGLYSSPAFAPPCPRPSSRQSGGEQEVGQRPSSRASCSDAFAILSAQKPEGSWPCPADLGEILRACAEIEAAAEIGLQIFLNSDGGITGGSVAPSQRPTSVVADACAMTGELDRWFSSLSSNQTANTIEKQLEQERSASLAEIRRVRERRNQLHASCGTHYLNLEQAAANVRELQAKRANLLFQATELFELRLTSMKRKSKVELKTQTKQSTGRGSISRRGSKEIRVQRQCSEEIPPTRGSLRGKDVRYKDVEQLRTWFKNVHHEHLEASEAEDPWNPIMKRLLRRADCVRLETESLRSTLAILQAAADRDRANPPGRKMKSKVQRDAEKLAAECEACADDALNSIEVWAAWAANAETLAANTMQAPCDEPREDPPLKAIAPAPISSFSSRLVSAFSELVRNAGGEPPATDEAPIIDDV